MATWGRTLTRNDDDTIPGVIVCVECVTSWTTDQVNPRNRIHRLRCGHAVAGRMERGKWTRQKTLSFNSGSCLWTWMNFVRQSGKPLWIFSQSTSEFLTLTGFWGLLESSEFHLKKNPTVDLQKIRSERLRRNLSRTIPGLLVETDPPTCLVAWHRDGWKIVALDLRNYLDKTPAQLANLCGIPEPRPIATDCSDDEASAAAEISCRVTQECVTRLCCWHDHLKLGHFAMTVSGMALACFRHKAYTHEIQLPPVPADREFERRGYFNGRTECLWLGEIRGNRFYPPPNTPADPTLYASRPRGPFHLIDARSFYGAVASSCNLPVACVAEGDGWPGPEHGPRRMDQHYMAHVHLVTNHHEFPVRLPDRTVFAVGDFWTVLCGPELDRAVSAGCVSDVGHWRLYSLEPALRWYADGLWSERQRLEQSGERLTAALVKGMLARLHGKFLQRDFRWQVVTNVQAPRPWHRWQVTLAETGETHFYRSIGWTVQRRKPAGDSKFCFPALAAWVTSWGREFIRHWMKLAGAGNVLHVSTDALVVTDEGRANLERAGIVGNPDIGGCRVVESSDHVAINGCNHYTLGAKVCLAGIPIPVQTRAGGPLRYTTRQRLAVTLARQPQPTVTETEQVAVFAACEEKNRIGPGGWLDRIKLSLEECQWQSTSDGLLT